MPITIGCQSFRSAHWTSLRLTEVGDAPGTTVPPHAHDGPVVTVVLEGGFDLSIAGRRLPCGPGTCVVEPAGEVHANQLWNRPSRVLILEPAACLVGDPRRGLASVLTKPLAFGDVRVLPLADRLRRELRLRDISSVVAAEAAGIELLHLAARRGSLSVTRSRPVWLARVVEHLHASLSRPVTVNELAREAGVHRVHLSRVFTAHFGCSLGDYHRRLRVERASAELVRSPDTLSAIALRAGFVDQSHFTRVFRHITGVTPLQYRRQVRGAPPW